MEEIHLKLKFVFYDLFHSSLRPKGKGTMLTHVNTGCVTEVVKKPELWIAATVTAAN